MPISTAFGKSKADGEINVDSKMASSIIKFVKMVMDVIDWDKKEG